MSQSQEITAYLTEAEKLVAGLKAAKQVISDELVVAMTIKGLSDKFNTFVASSFAGSSTTQSFEQLKERIILYDNTTNLRERITTNDKLGLRSKQNNNEQSTSFTRTTRTCYACGKTDHLSTNCEDKLKGKLFCQKCNSKTHNTEACRKT